MLWILLVGCVEYDLGSSNEREFRGQLFLETGISAPIAQAPVYANTSGRLYEIDPSTGETITVGDFRDEQGKIDNFIDIAIDLNGRLLGGTFDAIYSIDPTTAEVSHLCDTEAEMTAMTFTSNGELIVGGPDSLTFVDLEYNCEIDALIVDPIYQTSGDLVGLPDGYLYWTVIGDSADELVRIDPSTGMFAPVGELNFEQLYGLGYDQGELFGFSAQGEVVVISPDSAESSLRSVVDLSWWGATTNPVVW